MKFGLIRQVGSVSLIGVATLWAQAPAPQLPEDRVLNAASGSTTVAPGSIVSLFGFDFAADLPTPLTATLASTSVPLATSLGGLSVKFDGIEAPLFAAFRDLETGAGFDQINAQVPWEVDDEGTVTVEIMNGDGQVSEARQVQIDDVSPGIFAFSGQGSGAAIVQNFRLPNDDPANDVITGSFAQPAGSLPGLMTQPAPVGGVLIIFATGLGEVEGDEVSGNVPGQALPASKEVRVFVGGQEGQVLFAGLHATLVGLYQVNAVVPDVAPGDAVSIQLEADGVLSRNDATIAVRPALAVAAASGP